MVDIQKKEITPVCPHCEKPVQRLIKVERGWFGIHAVFCCPHCKKIVGMTGTS